MVSLDIVTTFHADGCEDTVLGRMMHCATLQGKALTGSLAIQATVLHLPNNQSNSLCLLLYTYSPVLANCFHNFHPYAMLYTQNLFLLNPSRNNGVHIQYEFIVIFHM